MTQTITKCNEIPTGKTYPVADLRTAESIEQLCEYVDAGHPIAWIDGGEAKLLQKHGERFNCYRVIKNDWQHQTIREETITHFVKLAPLAYRNGRPLHMGDEVSPLGGAAEKVSIAIENFSSLAKDARWRFADEVV